MEVFCPGCSNMIDKDSINVINDIAKCNKCGSAYKLSELLKLSNEQAGTNKLLMPSNSKITLNKTDKSVIEFLLPSSGLRGKSIHFLVFSIFWLILILFWTIMALQSSSVLVIFSIPFWLAAIGILALTINTAFEKQAILLNAECLTIQKIRPVKSKKLRIKINEIDSIKLENFKSYSTFNVRENRNRYDSDSNFSLLMPVVSYGINKQSFFENSSSAEKKWLVDILNELIERLKKEGHKIDFHSIT